MLRIVFLLLMLITISCKTVIENEQKAYKGLLTKHEKLKFMKIEGEIKPNTPQYSGSLSSLIEVAGRDSIKMQVYGPFGIEVARIFSSKENFIAYNVLGGEAFKGKPSPDALAKAININLNFDDLISFTRSEIPGNPNTYKYEKELDGGLSLYRSKQKKNFVEFATLNPNGDLAQYQQINSDGETLINVFFNDYQLQGDYNLAKEVVIKLPNNESEITIISDKYTFPEGIDDMSISIPSKIQIRELNK
ncbi:DUF4292 domain-containing protein [Candidatus Kapabacteria bacterium]|nr:DUF4292 domain-containing protein [Candidatus Kapabacteria bacterium]